MNKSLWQSYSDETNFPRLHEDTSVDVVVIGGGITGITTAQLLLEKGFSVAVLEKYKVGLSSTGHSTGNLYTAVSEILTQVQKKFGDQVMKMVIDSRREALELVEMNVRRFNLDCDFKKVSWNYYTTLSSNKSKITRARDSALRAGLRVEPTKLEHTPFKASVEGITLDEAAQFNPLRYVQGLAKAIRSPSCLIYEDSNVVDIEEGKEEVSVHCSNGRTVKARYLVHATHTPLGITAYHAELGPYREYGIACKIEEQHPEGVYFGYYHPEEVTSTRVYTREGETYLIAVGDPHKVGHADNSEHVMRLLDFIKEHFTVTKVTHTWAAQNYKSADTLPYIGHKRPGSRTFVATGMSSHGLTYGTVAAQLISDLIAGNSNVYEEIYRPYRFTPLKSAPKLIKENVDVVAQYVKDYLLKKNTHDFSDVPVGEGKLVTLKGHRLAVYRNEDDELSICSAVCTHMGCIVHWNNAEESWDCPCHGSRFDVDGAVLEGPAMKALASFNEIRESEVTHQEVPPQEDLLDFGYIAHPGIHSAP